MKSINTNQKNISISEKIKVFFRMISLTFKGDYKPNKTNLILGFLSVVYFFSPLDFIPEIPLGPVGFLDDAAILAFGYSRINKEIYRFIKWEEQLNPNNTTIDIE